ncbi:hypothetical protein [Bizionia myxarmorum]|uniref:Chromosome partitioning protein ParA n=1 Tax=Bizionia myxarmorum TaxID=291186 RepID=A0A5D0RC41_9FLAO|nr:hypothetical protein [Bizionia myxarmorum]TYB78953.1 hypothetical protein ES674_04035 [Bizionia myxarmorum]
MIVNPQIFSYKLIIGSLVIAIVVLGLYSTTSYSTLKNQKEVIEQEVKLVQDEMSSILALYDDSRINAQDLAIQMQQVKSEMSTILDSLDLVKTHVPLISKYTHQIASLLKERNGLSNKLKSILVKNTLLEEEAESKEQIVAAQEINLAKLAQLNIELSSALENVKELSLDNLEVKAIIASRNADDIQTTKARDLDNMEICFTVLKNNFTPSGTKDIFVQILGPDNTIVSSRGSTTIGKESLNYSGKTSINYRNDDLDVCTKININKEKPLKKGDYSVMVFHDKTMLGTSKIILN